MEGLNTILYGWKPVESGLSWAWWIFPIEFEWLWRGVSLSKANKGETNQIVDQLPPSLWPTTLPILAWGGCSPWLSTSWFPDLILTVDLYSRLYNASTFIMTFWPFGLPSVVWRTAMSTDHFSKTTSFCGILLMLLVTNLHRSLE
jgi:hypothetical protein